MNYGSVCSGIEAATVAWHHMGWTPAWFSEIEPFPCKLLKHYYPNTPNLGNMLHLYKNTIYQNAILDLLVGGTPCQSFSVAGLRRGLSDDRGNLALEYCRILKEKRPRWFVWENVPGVLSSYSDATGQSDEETSDFAAILAAFQQCGYCCAWRVLDAQFTGVPQRRRRIFVVGYLGTDWRPPAAVLFERESLSGNFKTGRKTREKTSGTITQRPYADGDQNGTLIPCWWDGGQLSQTLDRVLSKGQTMPEKNRFPAVLVEPLAFQSSQSGVRLSHTHATLDRNNGSRRYNGVLCYPYNQLGGGECRSNPQPGDPAPTLQKSGKLIVIPAVRRLTPLECERLQGFPDYYTNILGASDTVRYQAIGNSMAVPVMRWIGERINAVDQFLKQTNQ